MSADPRLLSTRTTWYRGASTGTVFFSYLPFTASRAPEARATETPAGAPETRAPKARRRATWPCRPPENGRPARHPAARRHHTRTTHPRTLRSLEPYSACRLYWIRKIFDCKKCPVHLVSFIKHDGLFVPYTWSQFFFFLNPES